MDGLILEARQMYESGLTMKDVAKFLGMDVGAVKRRFEKDGVKIRSYSENQDLLRGHSYNKTFIINEYNSGKTLTELATSLNTTPMTIRRIINKNGSDTRSIKDASTLKHNEELNEVKIVEMYNSGMAKKEIAAKLGYGESAVGKLLNKTKLKITNPTDKRIQEETLKNRDYLYNQYVNLDKSSGDIANDLSVSSFNVINHMKKFNIPIREASEAQMIAQKKPNRKTTHGKGQWIIVNGENRWVRSSWEILVINYLTQNEYKFRYEEVKFDLGDRSYTPDFFLYDENDDLTGIIEVKGWVSDSAISKAMLFETLYPDVPYYIWDKEIIDEIKQLKKEVA